MSKQPEPAPVTGPLDRVHQGVQDRDPVEADAPFAPAGVLVVPALPGCAWNDAESRRAAWSTLFHRVPDLTYTGVRRYLSPELHSEEGVLSGTLSTQGRATEAFTIQVRLLAHTGEEGISRLEVVGDVSALPASLGLSASSGALAVSSVFSLRQADGTGPLRVLGSTERPVDEPVAEQKPPPDEAAEEPPAPARRRSRRTPLVLALLAAVLAGSVGAVALSGDERPSRPSEAATPLATQGATDPATNQPSPEASVPPEAVPSIQPEAAAAAPQVQAGEQLVLRSDLLFATNSAELGPEATSAIAALAQTIRNRGITGVVQVNGYTDDTGTDAYDLALSQARALAVARSLQAALAGVPVTLQPQGFGKADPVADNRTPEGQAQNRRVTVILPQP